MASAIHLRPALEGSVWLFLLARLCFAVFFLLTSAYCLLAYVPFTYHWVIECQLVSWTSAFVSFHPYLYFVAIGCGAITLVDDFRKRATKRLAVGFLCFHSAAGILLILHPLLNNLHNDETSLVCSLIVLFPLLWMAAIDWAGHKDGIDWPSLAGRDRFHQSTAVFSATGL